MTRFTNADLAAAGQGPQRATRGQFRTPVFKGGRGGQVPKQQKKKKPAKERRKTKTQIAKARGVAPLTAAEKRAKLGEGKKLTHGASHVEHFSGWHGKPDSGMPSPPSCVAKLAPSNTPINTATVNIIEA